MLLFDNTTSPLSQLGLLHPRNFKRHWLSCGVAAKLSGLTDWRWDNFLLRDRSFGGYRVQKNEEGTKQGSGTALRRSDRS
jgi:hypothetical protein